MRLAVLVVVAMLGSVATAYADDIVVLPPLGKTADAASVSAALNGRIAPKNIDATCAGDPGCLAKTGSDLNAKRIVAITANGGGRLDIIVVDVGAKLLLGTRSITISPKKMGKELGPTLDKAVEEMTVDKAKALFAEGNEHYNLGEFKEALDRYKLAYRVKPLPAFQFNIAQCHRKLGQHQEAIAMYQAYLVGVPDAPNKAMVDSLIEESKKSLADESKNQSALEHDKLATEQKKAEETRKAKEAEAAANAERAKAEQARIAAERDRDKSYNKHPSRHWMLVTTALGLATVGAGAYFGVQARDAQSAFDANACGDPNQPRLEPVLAQCTADRDRGKRDALYSNILIGSGGAVVLVSAIVYALDPGNIERPTQQRVAFAVGPTSFKVMLRW